MFGLAVVVTAAALEAIRLHVLVPGFPDALDVNVLQGQSDHDEERPPWTKDDQIETQSESISKCLIHEQMTVRYLSRICEDPNSNGIEWKYKSDHFQPGCLTAQIKIPADHGEKTQ